VKVAAEDLTRVLYNAILFSDAKSQAAGLIGVSFVNDRMYMAASDDFVIIRDSMPHPSHDPFFIDVKHAKEVLKLLADAEADPEHFTIDELFTPAENRWEDQFGMAIGMMLDPKSFSTDEGRTQTFAIRPNRFAKFGRIKTTDDYPIDFQTGLIDLNNFTREVLRFKAGTTCHGILAPVLRSSLHDEFGEETAALW
jgi:hypothetical protein